MILLFYKKKYREAVLVMVSVLGSLFVLCLSWAGVYSEGSLFFGQTRMVLFWNFLALTLLFLSQTAEKEEPDADDSVNGPKRKLYAFITPLVFVLCVAGKLFMFEQEKKNEEGPLYFDTWISVMPVESLKQQAGQMVEIAEETGSDVLITTAKARVFAYGASALYYDKPVVFYVPDCDRRTWVFKEMEKTEKRRVLFYSLPVKEDMDLTLTDLEDCSVTDYLKQYNCERKVDSVWWGNPVMLK